MTYDRVQEFRYAYHGNGLLWCTNSNSDLRCTVACCSTDWALAGPTLAGPTTRAATECRRRSSDKDFASDGRLDSSGDAEGGTSTRSLSHFLISICRLYGQILVSSLIYDEHGNTYSSISLS